MGVLLLMIEILSITLRALNYGNYGTFRIMGHAGFISSTVVIIGAALAIPLASKQPKGLL